MGLHCKTPAQIAYLVSVYFIGYVVGTCFYFLPDKIGRKKSIIGSLSLNLISEAVMLWSSNYYVRMAGFFFQGMFMLQNSTSY